VESTITAGHGPRGVVANRSVRMSGRCSHLRLGLAGGTQSRSAVV